MIVKYQPIGDGDQPICHLLCLLPVSGTEEGGQVDLSTVFITDLKYPVEHLILIDITISSSPYIMLLYLKRGTLALLF